jgi:hypothetical protein
VLKNSRAKLVFASDRRAVAGNYKYKCVSSKVVKRGEFIIAGAGSAFLDSVLQEHLSLPGIDDDTSVASYMFNTFLPIAIDTLRKFKIIHESENRLNVSSDMVDKDDDDGASFLIGVKGHLFEFTLDNHAVGLDEVPPPYAIGSGGSYALGSLITTANMKYTVKARLKMAIEAAAKLDPFVDNQIDFTVED